MTTTEIIQLFGLITGDTTDLSSSESLSLAEKWYRRILNDRAWDFLRTEFRGTVTGTTMTLPADFSRIVPNFNHTDNTIETEHRANPYVVFIGTNFTPYRVVNFSDRYQYRNEGNICWIDLRNNQLVFSTSDASGQSIVFTYLYKPAILTLSTSPVFDSDFHYAIAHGMASDDFDIQLFDKNKSYAQENLAKYNKYLLDMQYHYAQFNMN